MAHGAGQDMINFYSKYEGQCIQGNRFKERRYGTIPLRFCSMFFSEGDIHEKSSYSGE